MELIIPCSLSDVGLLPKLADVLNKFGPYPGHSVTVMPTAEIEQQGREFAKKIEGSFTKTSVSVVQLNASGWPVASNKHFRQAAHYASQHFVDAWYFFEPDNTPVAKGWLTELIKDYTKGGRPFCGCVVPTRGFVTNADGSKSPSFGDPHMVGTGIYPPNYGKDSAKLPTVDIVMHWSRSAMEPFDVALRYEIAPRCFNTKLIQHNWQTCNYRVENGLLVCDSMPHVDKDLSHAQPWNGAMVIHGCKDGSLADLVLSGKFPHSNVTAATSTAGENVVENVPSPVADGGRQSDDTPPKTEKKPVIANFLAFKIQNLLKEKKKALSANSLASILDVPVADILSTIRADGSGLRVAGPAKWVNLA